MFKKILLYCLLLSTCFVSACSDKPLSREDEIRLYIDQGVAAAEDRSASDLAELIDEGYRDDKKLDRLQLKKMAQLYFFRHKNIFLFTKIREIKFYSDSEASVTLHVAMAGSVIADASVLSSLRARIYRFELQLIKDQQWLLQSASWHPASMDDMQ